MIWGAVWNAIFISTVFPIITLNSDEFKAFNLFERTNKRNDLEETASYVVTNSIKILRQLNSQKKIALDVDKIDKNQLKCLKKMRQLSKLRKEMDSLVIETLYFEDDMLTKMELVLELNEKITAI
jgi:NADH dehydrogenase/NADH:ubiquinone oxidoreductase subunit G